MTATQYCMMEGLQKQPLMADVSLEVNDSSDSVVTEDGRTYLFTSADDNNVDDDMMMIMMMMCPRVSS